MTITGKLRAIGRSRGMRYAVSLPERTVRSVAVLAAGIVHETAGVVLPIGVRRGRVYRNLVDATLQLLIERVGEVDVVHATDQELGENFLVRRAAGNGIELMGILAFRASPVWVLAALADLCGFGRYLIPQIAEVLKREGLLDATGSFTTMDQLLEGLEGTAAQLAETANAPPLDVAGLRREWAKLVTEVRRLPTPQLPTRASVLRLWDDLRSEAAAQGRTVFELSSLLAVSAVSELPERVRVLSKSAAVALRRSGTVVSDALLEHYREALAQIRAAGFLGYGARQLAPYARAAVAAFHPERETLTGKLLGKL
jgi:hypothetical protein